MSSFDYIIHPTTGKKVKTDTTLGKKIINNYAKITDISPSSINKVSNKIQNKIEDNETLNEFRNIIDTTFKVTVDELLNHTQRILTEEQHINLAIIHYNIMKMNNHSILEQFNGLNTDQKNPSNHNLVLLILKCLGMQQQDILSIMPSEQKGGWYGCVEPGVTHEEIEQKSPIQKRRMCQRNTGHPVGRFPNSQSCVQAVMYDPTLCNPPPTLGERVRHSAAYAAGRVGAAASGARSGLESSLGTSYVALMSFLTTIPSIGVTSAAILSIVIVLICVLSGFSNRLDTNISDFLREYRACAERVRQADERDRIRREREERERREYQRQMDRLAREARERRERMEQERHRIWMETNQQRLEALARTERRRIATQRIRKAIKKVLSASKFVKEAQVNISDKLRLGTDSNYLSLIGYRVHVIGKGFGTIVDYDESKKRDIISYDIRHGSVLSSPVVKPIVLGTTRRYRKHLTSRVGKAFRLISSIHNQLVPWPMPRTAVPLDDQDGDVPMARALSETDASRQMVTPSGLMVNTHSSDEAYFLQPAIARGSRPTPMPRILSGE